MFYYLKKDLLCLYYKTVRANKKISYYFPFVYNNQLNLLLLRSILGN